MDIVDRYKRGERDFRGADLRWANLSEADLSEANLRGADLSGADLSVADLSVADLSRADLRWADLSGADLRWADLRWADLRWADLREANLSGADLSEANLPSPTIVLLCDWGDVSDQLCRDLMQFDASCYPDPVAFDRWANDEGSCPYCDVRIQRATNFAEKKDLWSPGTPPRPYDLMVMLIIEKCANSDWHEERRK